MQQLTRLNSCLLWAQIKHNSLFALRLYNNKLNCLFPIRNWAEIPTPVRLGYIALFNASRSCLLLYFVSLRSTFLFFYSFKSGCTFCLHVQRPVKSLQPVDMTGPAAQAAMSWVTCATDLQWRIPVRKSQTDLIRKDWLCIKISSTHAPYYRWQLCCVLQSQLFFQSVTPAAKISVIWFNNFPSNKFLILIIQPRIRNKDFTAAHEFI